MDLTPILLMLGIAVGSGGTLLFQAAARQKASRARARAMGVDLRFAAGRQRP